ncbi:hypothetical protein Fuma_02755 [Fuerstiella marisgermanici]|uniref:SGNH hydrolase-type esterase domain-containing protein n=2 Tax=Fuerstiella marisgermanici TaxID=1891926 RepID=A0A1P8WGD9_9PLAN|nr:hypothetical protein Fuma_02755 [Fuerstiella marisgermanici]
MGCGPPALGRDMRRTLLIGLIFLLSTTLHPVETVAVSQDGSDSESEQSSVWLRHTLSLKPADAITSTTELLVDASTGAVTVYFNGQRLVRGRAADKKAWSFDVNPLVRNGTNSVAISISAPKAEKPKLAVQLTPHKGQPQKLTNWKATSDVPPVGWQQTDFNDRDWKPADKSLLEKTEFGEIAYASWTPTGGPTRFADGRFRCRDGDHVVLIGGTFIERAQQYGHLECALNPNPAAKVTFRNLGWSGDTAFAESRGIFDTPAKGYERLIEHVRAEDPSVILVCYGQNEAMSVPVEASAASEVSKFEQQIQKLHADLQTTGAEIVFLTPHPFVRMPEPLPDATVWTSRLKQFTSPARKLGDTVHTIDLFTDFVDEMANADSVLHPSHQAMPDADQHPELIVARNSVWTDNGMHWNDAGYLAAAQVVSERLTGRKPQSPSINVDLAAKSAECVAGKLRNVTWNSSPNVILQCEVRRDLVSPFPMKVAVIGGADLRVELTAADDHEAHALRSVNLLPELSRDKREFVGTIPAEYRELAELTVQKNELYFHRWRPQNITYLFGFRKHEQGNNASEIAMFDPLIQELEAKIFEAREPKWQTVTIRTKETVEK